MRTRTRFRNVGAGPLAETDATGKGAELRDVPAPTISEMQVVAAAWPIYDRLLADEDEGRDAA